MKYKAILRSTAGLKERALKAYTCRTVAEVMAIFETINLNLTCPHEERSDHWFPVIVEV